jgi:hypothetical protein
MGKYITKKTLTPAERKTIIKLHFEKKISQAQLARDFDTNRTTVNQLCKAQGVSPRRTFYSMDDAEIIRLYVEEKKSVLQISKILGTTPRPITRRLRLAGIEKKVSKRYFWEKTIPHFRLKFKIWVAKVIELDKMLCVLCGCENTFENRLEAHHVIPVRDMKTPDLLFDTNNGVTLCNNCHLSIHYREKEYEDIFNNLIRTRSSE